MLFLAASASKYNLHGGDKVMSRRGKDEMIYPIIGWTDYEERGNSGARDGV